jgi:hypothetical protein
LGNKGQFDLSFLDIIDTEQKAYILGFLQCDGSFSCKTSDGKGYYRYKLAIQEKDKDVLERIKQYAHITGKTSIQKPKLSHRQDIYEISFNSRVFADKLASRFGGFKKEDRLNVPELSGELVRHYIRGVFDADGSFGDYAGVMLRFEGKLPFLQGIAELVGFNGEIRPGNGATTYTLRLNGPNALRVGDWMYGGLTEDSFFLPRKLEVISNVFEQRGIPFKGAA